MTRDEFEAEVWRIGGRRFDRIDIAKILADNFEVGKEYGEAEVFDVLMDKSSEFVSLANSRQDPTYLFRYYRGLGNDGKHAGLVARDFIRVIS